MGDYWDDLLGAKPSKILDSCTKIPIHEEKINMILFHKNAIEQAIENLEQKPSFSVIRKNTIHYRNKLEKIWNEKENKCTCSESVACTFCMER